MTILLASAALNSGELKSNLFILVSLFIIGDVDNSPLAFAPSSKIPVKEFLKPRFKVPQHPKVNKQSQDNKDYGFCERHSLFSVLD